MAGIISLLLVLSYVPDISAQPYGHVKLVESGQLSVVTVYLPSEESYVPICSSGFDRGAAAAVCRQNGYLDAAVVPTSRFSSPSDTSEYFGKIDASSFKSQKYLKQVKCPTVSDYAKYGELHLMRCIITYSNGRIPVVVDRCDPSKIAAVKCSKEEIHYCPEYLYKGQVYLLGKRSEYYKGMVRMMMNTSGPNPEHGYYSLCLNDNINEQTTRSICRQLGYTGGTHSSASLSTTTRMKLKKSKCVAESFNCFSHCISTDANYEKVTEKCHEVHVECDFKEEEIHHSEGSRQICNLGGSASVTLTPLLMFFLILVSGSTVSFT